MPEPRAVAVDYHGPAALQGNTAFATSIALLLLRLALGWVFVYAGSQKLFGVFGGIGMTTWTQVMEQAHLPVLPGAAWAWIAACSEFGCGCLVLLGLLSRLASIPLIVTMCVAIATVTGANGFGGAFDPVKGYQPGYNLNMAMIAIAAAVLIAGPGLISVDALIFRRGLWARGPQPLSVPGERRL